jgi:5-formyltetrahydrofolate cyclo-ligase
MAGWHRPMNPTIAQSKADLRRGLRRPERSAEERRALSQAACVRLQREPCWTAAATILFYSARGDEIDLAGLIKEALAGGKTAALLKFEPDSNAYASFQVKDLARDCAPGKFGLGEPGPGCGAVPVNQLDLVLVPGVAFDPAGHRLGRGRGYYDRLLAGVAGIKCGVAFDEQIVPAVPVEPHDIILDCIVTPTRWLDIRSRAV